MHPVVHPIVHSIVHSIVHPIVHSVCLPHALRLLTILGVASCCWAPKTFAQSDPNAEKAASTIPIGALDLGVAYWMSSAPDSDGLMLRATAMAIDRVKGTSVGRFGELRLSGGFSFQGDIIPYEIAFKLGVGIATDYFTLFIATGILSDAFEALDDAADPKAIPSAAGMPMTLGLWITPMRSFYVLAMAEPAWYFGVEERQTTVKPVDFGEEMRARLGLGWEIDTLHLRLDYVYHQVSPNPFHLFTLGAGVAAHIPAF